MSFHEYRKRSARVTAKAWQDEDFRKELVNNPEAVLREHGIRVPEGKKVRVVEDTHDTMHVVLPHKPEDLPHEEDLSNPEEMGPMLTTFAS